MIRARAMGIAAVAMMLAAAGCKDDPTEPAEFPSEGEVFLDEYGDNVTFQAFAGSKYDAVQVDQVESYEGTASLKVTVPAPGDPSGTYAGGAFTTNVARDLTEFDVLTFWARASTASTLDVAGIGNDNTGTSRFTAERRNIPLTTSWTKVVIPVPLASRLDQEGGLFFFAEGPEGNQGNTIWFDEVQYETLGTLANPRPVIGTKEVSVDVGGTVNVDGTQVTYDVAGTDITVTAMAGYFTFTSSDESVATVSADGVITGVGMGTATITAELGTVAAAGSVTVHAVAPPQSAAPTPTVPEADVISLFSNAYTNVTVDSWSADWPDDADVEDAQIQGDDVKKYTNLVYAGIVFESAPVDASAMTRFHMDIWTPDPTADPAAFKVKLVDFGADATYGGGDDSEHELTFTENTTPALATGSWVSIDVPMADFAGLTNRSALAQMVISGDPNTVYVDNVYFYDDGSTPGPTAPEVAAPTPTVPEADVISLFSNAYTDVVVDTWSADWPDMADVADAQVQGDDVKLYTNLVYAGIVFESQKVDASAMTHFHMDIWTPDPTADPAAFKVKLVDFGADATYGGGDDVESELTFTANSTPPLATGSWVSIDVPLADFTGLTTRGALAQMVISADPNTVYVDNVYFYAESGGSTAPETAAPTPTAAEADVISLFSNAYTDVTVDSWSADWPDMADVADAQVQGDDVKLYTNLVYAGIVFESQKVDASAMTRFHMDIWTPDPTADPAAFKVKLVDFGPDATYGGGDDSEHELTFTASTTPALATGSWVSIDVPLADFAGLTNRSALAQMVISGDPNTVYVDNVYFYDDGSTPGPTAPEAAAPTPTVPEADVISLFSNAYTDVVVDSWSADWPDMADVADAQVQGDDVKLYTNLVYAGIVFESQKVDASAMTHFHMDIWTPDPTADPAAFKVKLVDFGADATYGGGDDVEHELTFTASTTPALATGSWVSIEVPLSEFTNLTTRGALAQMIISGDPNTVYMDNVYFHK